MAEAGGASQGPALTPVKPAGRGPSWRVTLGLITAALVGLVGISLVARSGDSASAPAPTPIIVYVNPAPTPTLWTDGKAAAVVGSMDCNPVVKAGAESSPGVKPHTLTHQIFRCTVTTNDPRVNGSGNLDLNIEGWDPILGYNAVDWAYQEIKGPAGSWAGRIYGVHDKEGFMRALGVLVGSGAYKGLVFVNSGTVPVDTANVDIIGVIQPGTPPPGFPVTPLTTP
jgi:hypothetical protein